MGCSCAVCTGGHPRNQRTRCSAVLGLPEGNLLIDTPPDLRQQLLRELKSAFPLEGVMVAVERGATRREMMRGEARSW